MVHFLSAQRSDCCARGAPDLGVDVRRAGERAMRAGEHGDGVAATLRVGDDADFVADTPEQTPAFGGEVAAVWDGRLKAAGDLPRHDLA